MSNLKNKLTQLESEFQEKSVKAFLLKSEYASAADYIYRLEKEIRKLREELSLSPANIENQNTSVHDEQFLIPKSIKNMAKRSQVDKTVRVEDDQHLLRNVVIGLVRTEGSANIGSICRIACNMGVTDIRLISPQCNPVDTDARKYAHHSIPLLTSLPVYNSIEEATLDCKLVIATSARQSIFNIPQIEPQEIVSACIESDVWNINTMFNDNNISDTSNSDENDSKSSLTAFSSRNSPKTKYISYGPRVCILFGPESTGLKAEEISLSKYSVYIPTRGPYPSLNLSQAVTSVLTSVFLTGHPHSHFEAPSGKKFTGIGLGSGTFTTENVSKILDKTSIPNEIEGSNVDISSSDRLGAGSGSSDLQCGKKVKTCLASKPEIHRLLEYFYSTMVRWNFRHASQTPKIFEESMIRYSVRLFGQMTTGDVKFLFGVLANFNKHPCIEGSSPSPLPELLPHKIFISSLDVDVEEKKEN